MLTVATCGGSGRVKQASHVPNSDSSAGVSIPVGPYAYAVDADPQSKVARIRAFFVPAGGGRAREITTLPGIVKYPRLSAGAARIAYVILHLPAHVTEIRVQNGDGSADHRIFESRRAIYNLAIAPDASSVVVTMDAVTLQTAAYLYAIPISGGAPTRVTNEKLGRYGYEGNPAFDGPRTVFFSRDPAGYGAGKIYAAKLGGSTPRKIVGTSGAAEPRVSPDRKRLLYDLSAPQTNANTHLVVANVDGSNPHLLPLPPPGHTFRYPAWTPDGTEIVASYDINDKLPDIVNSVMDLYAMRPDGTGLRRLTSTAGSEVGVDFPPSAGAP